MNDEKVEQAAPSALEQRLAALKARSFKLSPEAEKEAHIAKHINEEEQRLNSEGAKALAAHAEKVEADCRAKVKPGEAISAIYKWEIHYLTATDRSSIEGILASGRGLVVVRGASRKAAVKCAAALGAAGSGGRSGLFVNRPEDVEVVLRNAVVYPSLPVLNEMIGDDRLPGFLAAAAREAADLAGTWAETTAGKSKS